MDKKTITYVYGHSDDLIEVDGLLYDEIGCYGVGDDEPAYLACSDGTLLGVEYDGEWKFSLVRLGSQFKYIKPPTGEGKSHSDFSKVGGYSSIVIFEGKLNFVLFGEKLVR
jgi:hypothetical protein